MHVLELKKEKNAKVGALSELIFYVAVLEEAREGRWHFKEAGPKDANAEFLPEHVKGARCIKGHLLAPDFHPLIDKELLELVSSAMAGAGWKTSIDRCRLDLSTFAVDCAA